MKKAAVLFLAILCQVHLLKGQGPIVPSELQFADIRLKINESARREIQDDVDAMTQSPRYFNEKLLRVQLYFPVIEKILAEENVPDDFKYLVIQESALIPDAVSSSKAVGYWQFKDFTAIEMGLRVDNHIDERMNIVSSTHAAARYFKKNNFYFDNWVYALQAYQMGAGAALKVVDEKERGAKSMTITKKTYWYVKKYLAHRIAYEYGLERQPALDKQLMLIKQTGDKSLRSIASELKVEEEVLTSYNMWLKRGKIPSDKDYTVIVPVNSGEMSPLVVAAPSGNTETTQGADTSPSYTGLEDPDRFPVINEKKGLFNKNRQFVDINGIPGIIGHDDHTPQELAELAEISEAKFRSFNEILPHESIKEGQVYYFKKKKSKAKVHYHTVNHSETLWDISQKYGVRLSKLLKKNRFKEADEIKPGMVLWLRYVRSADDPIIFRDVPEEIIATVKDETSREIVAEEIMEPQSDPPDQENLIMADSINNEVKEPSAQESAEETEQQESIKIIHEVEPRETLYSISKSYGVGVMEVVAWNDLNIAEGIMIGQLLTIWVTEGWKEKVNNSDVDDNIVEDTQKEGFLEYRVQPGDTLYAIASKYGVTIEDIQSWNKKIDASISIGEKIRIKQ